MSNIKDKLNKIVSNESSKWIDKAEWQISNEDWLDKSAKIALKILRTIREKEITQIKLAELLNVSPQHISKIVQGKENLTLETISKLEKVLNITLIEIPVFQSIDNLSENINKKSNVADSKIKYHK
jgi:plasmid maintenance system antidote protein VapI